MAAFVGVILIFVGLFHTLRPRTAWYIHYGWRFQDVEPSDGYLAFLRVTGVMGMIAGVICIIVTAFG